MIQFKSKHNVAKTFLPLFLLLLFASCGPEIEYVYKESISIKSMPEKTSYFVGEKINYEGLVVVAVKESGESIEITDYEIVPSANTILSEQGKQNVTIKYKDKQVEFNITVEDPLFYFTEQPSSKNFELYSDAQTLSCAVAVLGDGGILQFSWHRKNPNEAAYTEIFKSEPQNVENWKTYAATVTLPQNNYVKAQYYCEAIFTKDNATKIVKSDIAEVEQVVNAGVATVFVNTENEKDLIYKTDKLKSFVRIVDADGTSAQYENVTFGGRGNSSWGMPKKSYSLKFDSKTEILGMKKSKKWVLIANYADKTLFRNDFASYLANTIFKNMEWNPSFKSINLVKNGEYIGTYLLGEQIKLEESRVNVQSAADSITGKSKYKDLNGDGKIDIKDGGFIVEINARLDENFNFKTAKGVCISLKDPDTDDFVSGATSLSEEVSSYIKNIIQNTEDAIYSEDFADEENGYAKYIDVDSFIDWYFVNEIAKNNDAIFFSSVYMYYDPKDQKLHMGPIWDFDIGFGNIDYNGCDDYEGFWIKNSAWYNRLFEDPNFVNKVKSRWNEISQELHNAITTEIQKKADSLLSSANSNFVRWPILGIYVWPNAAGYKERTTYQSEIDYMKDWLEKRYLWLSSSIQTL